MKPVDQNKFGPKEGNCWAACIASILELPIEEVPNFVVEYEGDYWKKTEEWVNGLVKTSLWLKGYELGIVTVHCGGSSPLGCIGTTYWIGVGKSARGQDHAVVYHGEDLLHDPHPDKTGLEGVPWSGTFFVLRNPRFSAPLKSLYRSSETLVFGILTEVTIAVPKVEWKIENSTPRGILIKGERTTFDQAVAAHQSIDANLSNWRRGSHPRGSDWHLDNAMVNFAFDSAQGNVHIWVRLKKENEEDTE